MKIAITGGSGFIGSEVAREAQERNHDVIICDSSTGCDVTSNELDLTLGGADHVIHLAGVLGTHELFDSPAEAVRVNIQGSLNVMQWCLNNHAQYTGILMPDVFPSIYTATKVGAKRLADALHHSAGLKVSHVRAFNAFGPGQKFGPGHPQKIVPTFAVAGWRNLPMPVWGTGEQWTDLIHTADLARMLVDATHFVNNEVFDGGTGMGVTVSAVARFTAKVTGSTAGIERLPMRRGEVETQIRALGEGWDLLGWQPRLNWDSLAETIQWYREPSLGDMV